MNVQPKLGVDFDGVISDSRRMKSKLAQDLFDVMLPIEMTKRELAVGNGILTSDQYTQMVDSLYNTEYCLLSEEMAGAIESIKMLQINFEIKVVTARSSKGVFFAQKWCQQHGLGQMDIEGTSGKDKTNALKGFDIFIDDDLDKLEPLIGKVTQLFWLSGVDTTSPHEVIKVGSWRELLEKMNLSMLKLDATLSL